MLILSHLPRTTLRAAAPLLGAVALLLGGPARGQDATTGGTTTEQEAIPDFRLTKIEGIPSSIDFASRFGAGSTRFDFEHRTNIADCPAYNLEEGSTTGALEHYEQVTGAAEEDGGSRDDTSGGSAVDPGTCTLGDTEPRVKISWSGDSSLAGAQWRAFVGHCTKATDLSGDVGTTCYALTDDTKAFSSGNNSFEAPLTVLIGTQKVTGNSTLDDRRCCSATTTGADGNSVSLWVAVTDPSGIAGATWQKVVFAWDYVAPGTPSGVAVDDAGETMNVSWNAPSNATAEAVTYTVYWDTQSFASRAEAGSSKSVSGKLTSTTLTGLAVGTTYYVGVGATDDFDNEGPLSSVVSGTPVETQDGFERYKSAGGGEEGGYCFVATAAYGSPLHPHVQLLRGFRDSWLLTNEPGRAFVSFYYANGPRWASFVAPSSPLRVVVQVLLVPLLLLAWFLVKLTLLEKVLVVAALWMARRVVREVLRRRYWAPPLVPTRRS